MAEKKTEELRFVDTERGEAMVALDRARSSATQVFNILVVVPLLFAAMAASLVALLGLTAWWIGVTSAMVTAALLWWFVSKGELAYRHLEVGPTGVRLGHLYTHMGRPSLAAIRVGPQERTFRSSPTRVVPWSEIRQILTKDFGVLLVLENDEHVMVEFELASRQDIARLADKMRGHHEHARAGMSISLEEAAIQRARLQGVASTREG